MLRKHGFSLVVTVAMLVVMTVIAVGLLSLSAISLKSVTLTSAEQRAQANARMALMMAIDRLQSELGPDQRISANSAILDTATVRNPHILGVWDSWRAGNATFDRYPDTLSSHRTIVRGRRGDSTPASMHPTYDTNRADHFRSWLMSMNDEWATDITTPRIQSIDGASLPVAGSTAVTLVGTGSLGETAPATDLVHAPLIDVASEENPANIVGRYGWWIGDESQKASLIRDSRGDLTNPAIVERLFSAQAPAGTGYAAINGLNTITDDRQIDRLASRNTIALIGGVSDNAFQRYHDLTYKSLGVLADVREGGLKRDLNAILERPIDPDEVYTMEQRPGVEAGFDWPTGLSGYTDEFMLYTYDGLYRSTVGQTTGQASVPIQDLAAYYQLYDHNRSGWAGGMQYTSRDSSPANSLLTGGVMVSPTDTGALNTTEESNKKYLRAYTGLYRKPVPIKYEIVLHYAVEPILPEPDPSDPSLDRYTLRMGFSPAITLWNPYNVPMVLNIGDPEQESLMVRANPVNVRMKFQKKPSYWGRPTEEREVDLNEVACTQQGEIYTLFISGNNPVRLEPGEARVFSMQATSNTNAVMGSTSVDFALRGRVSNRYDEQFIPELELVPGWNPTKFCRPIATGGTRRFYGDILTFKSTDYIGLEITGVPGGFTYDWAQKSQLPYLGFPKQNSGSIAESNAKIIRMPPRSARDLVRAMRNPYDPRDDLPMSFLYYGLNAAVETHESNNLFEGAGRRFPSRPYLHTSLLNPTRITSLDGGSMYNNGWNWFFKPIDNVFDAPISLSRDSHGYHGGGYTADQGVNHVVQQHLPLAPPISIASLSNAMLGGFSLASEAPAAGYSGLSNAAATDRDRRVTALGWGGLLPHMLQAIGNSYAHPMIPSDEVITTWSRYYYGEGAGAEIREPFADHSYLANKALWDDYFFSSITPQTTDVEVFGLSTSRTVSDVASGFFFDNEKLPNRRFIPHTNGLDQDTLDALVADYGLFQDGFADKIASYMMVNGAFNVNSTSVEAWKAALSGLKGKPVAYLDKERSLTGSINIDDDSTTGMPVSGGQMANGRAYTDSTRDPSDPEQWYAWRELTDREIEELAEAMVEQVKLRGPFLSLSEFVNRRLGPSTDDRSVKGALQAALDDPDVSINDGFRSADRQFNSAEINFVNPVFRKAMEGAIAYGSPAYVDQADILSNMAAQLTPRGDTFVVRAYGDSLDANGNVEARAWCEATVQRLPEYVDSADEPYLKQEDLSSSANRAFGRKFVVVSFRWLNPSEI